MADLAGGYLASCAPCKRSGSWSCKSSKIMGLNSKAERHVPQRSTAARMTGAQRSDHGRAERESAPGGENGGLRAADEPRPTGPVHPALVCSPLVRARIMLRAWPVWDNRAVSPRSRGRPPGRRRLDIRQAAPAWPGDGPPLARQDAGDCWFEEPSAADRRSWAAPPVHGICREMDLELLDPGDDDELVFLIEALHHDGGTRPAATVIWPRLARRPARGCT
jgi:hypothetical protein